MKHSRSITVLLVGLFLLAQFIGLFITDAYIERNVEVVDGKEVVNVEVSSLPYDIERPAFEAQTAFIPFILMILLGTVLILLIIKFKLTWLWKVWFFLAVFLCLLIAFYPFMPLIATVVAALLLSLIKTFQKNPYVHNFTELFVYGGLAAIFSPVLNVFSVSMLLILISIYDIIAVRKTKHMVTMAESHTAMDLFPGIHVKYGKKDAVLGGGDIGLPLLFAATLMQRYGYLAFVIPIAAAVALTYLFVRAEKEKFYPAMPYLTAGCYLGFGIMLLI